MITKELLGNILNLKVDSIDKNNPNPNFLKYLINGITYTYDYTLLANKCKDWAFNNGYSIGSLRTKNIQGELPLGGKLQKIKNYGNRGLLKIINLLKSRQNMKQYLKQENLYSN